MITKKPNASADLRHAFPAPLTAVAALVLAAAASGGCAAGDDTTAITTGASATTGAGGAGGGGGSSASGTGGSISPADELINALGTSTWHAFQTRGGKERAYELLFDAPSMLWAEVRNPYGPARLREMRSFTVDADGKTVHSTVVTPVGWPPHPEDGRLDDWTIEIVPGPPQMLRTTRNGTVELFEEGPWPPPTDGLTAEVRVFPSGGAADNAFCSSGASGFDYAEFLNFARGLSTEAPVTADIVAGAKLLTWHDVGGTNNFAVVDVDGFDLLGGTELTNQSNFFVRYTGTMVQGGGELRMRELNDSVEDGVWVFLAGKVGSNNPADLFLEVHGFIWADATPDEVAATVSAGEIPIEIIVARCTNPIEDVDVQIGFGTGPFQLVGNAPSKPAIDDTLFPPAF